MWASDCGPHWMWVFKSDHKNTKTFLRTSFMTRHRTELYKHHISSPEGIGRHRNSTYADFHIWMSLTGHGVNTTWVVVTWVGYVGGEGKGQKVKAINLFDTCHRVLTTPTAFHFTLIEVKIHFLMDWSHVNYLLILVMFLSAVWTLTAPIHYRGSIGEEIM